MLQSSVLLSCSVKGWPLAMEFPKVKIYPRQYEKARVCQIHQKVSKSANLMLFCSCGLKVSIGELDQLRQTIQLVNG
jgi:hypothetical protein